MKRYDSLRTLFWVLASGLSAGMAQATTATATATNTSGDTLVVDSDTYDNIQNFSLSGGSLTTELVGMSGGTLTLAPNSNPFVLTLSGADGTAKSLTDSYVFDGVADTGPVTLRIAPFDNQVFTLSGSFSSTRSEDILEITGSNNAATATFTGDLSAFRSHFKATSGTTRIEGTTGVMTQTEGGLISLEGGNSTMFLHTTGTRDIGASGSGLLMNAASGYSFDFGGSGTQTIYATLYGPGSTIVSGGSQIFAGPHLNTSGGLSVASGSATLQVSTGIPLTLSGDGVLTLAPSNSAAYNGAISHTSSGALTVNSAGNIVTLTGSVTGSGPVVVAAGELRLEPTAIFHDSAYSGSGTLHIHSGASETLNGGLSGALSLRKSGAGALTISTAALDNTGTIDIDNGRLIVSHDLMGSNFASSTAAVNLSSGTEMEMVLGMASGSPLDLSGRTFTGPGTLRLNTGLASDQITLGGATIGVGTINLTGTPNNTGGTFRLVFDGSVPTSDIERSSALHILRFSGISGTFNGTIDAAGDSTAPVELVSSSDLLFTTAGTFSGTVSVDATSTARFEGAAINTSRVLSGAGNYVLSPTATHTIASDILTGSGTLTFEGGSSTDTQFTFTAAQSFTGTVEVVDGNLTTDLANMFPNASAVNVRNSSYLHVLGEGAQVANIFTFDNGNLDGVVTGPEITGEGLVMDASVSENQTYSESLEGFSDSIITRSSAVLDINATQVSLGENPASSYVMEADATDGSMRFSGGTEMLLRGNPRFNSGAGKFFKLDSAVLKHHPTASGRIKRLFGTGGFSVDTGDLTIDTQFARRIEEDTDQGLRLNSTGRVIKGGFGTFAIKKALATARNSNTTSTIIVNNGNLELHASSSADAIAGASGPGTATDIEMARSTNLDFHLAADATFSRFAAGDGGMRFYADGSARTLTFDGSNHGAKGRYTLATKGDFIVGDNVTVVMQNNEVDNTGDIEWRPGPAAQLQVSDTGGALTFSGVRLIPEAPHINITGGTLSIAGNTELGVLGTNVTEILLGNTSDSLTIGSGASLRFWDLASGKQAQIEYTLVAADNTAQLILDDAGSLLIEQADISSFDGVIRNSSSGHLILKNKATADINSGLSLDFGSSAGTMTIDINADLELSSAATLVTSTANFEKRGSGNLIFDATSGLSNCSGDFNIYSGRSQWHQVERGSSHNTIVHRGAGLYVAREWEGGTTIELGHIDLRSGARLVLSEQVWDTPANAAASADLQTVNISQLDAAAGSEIVFHLNPSRAVTGAADPDLSLATAPLTLAASFGSGSLNAPIYIRAVAITDAALSNNSIFPLIKFANSTDADAFAGKIKVRPSIKGVASSLYYMGSAYGGVSDANHSTMYGQPYRYTDSNDSNAQWLVLQINSNEFAPGQLEAKTDFSTHSHPTGIYTIANSFLEEGFEAYSPLDGLLTAITTHNRQLDYHLSLLKPQSYQEAEVAYSLSGQILNAAMNRHFDDIAEQQRWSTQLKSTLASHVLQSIEQQQNLQSRRHVRSLGRLQCWSEQIQGLAFASQGNWHKLDAQIMGMALRLSPSLATGYQHTATQQSYRQEEGWHCGTQSSHYGSGFVQITEGEWNLQSQTGFGLHQHDHERHMRIDVAPGLSDQWVARSAYYSATAQQKVALWRSAEISRGMHVSAGMISELNAGYAPQYRELGAGNLNLIVEEQKSYSAIATPLMSLDYRGATDQGFFSGRIAAGYQSVLTQSHLVRYGLQDSSRRHEVDSEKPNLISGITASCQIGWAQLGGLAVQAQYNTVAAVQHQAQLSLLYAF